MHYIHHVYNKLVFSSCCITERYKKVTLDIWSFTNYCYIDSFLSQFKKYAPIIIYYFLYNYI